MILIPAIDLKNGECVRLKQGRMEDATVYGNDPVAMARHWVDAGARRLHVVDLDGAFAGRPVNADAIARIVEACPDVPVQVGGGIRNQETVETYLAAGVRYVVIGTQAVREPEFVGALCARFPHRIIVGLDARDGLVAVEGWAEVSEHQALDFARRFERDGVAAIIYTDIGRDGMMHGVNTAATAEMARGIEVPVIASGGVSALDDIHALCDVADVGIEGVVIGRALYEGTIDLGEAQRVVDERC